MSRLTQAIERSLSRVDAKLIFDHGRWFDARETADDVARIQWRLQALGVHAGDRVFIALPNSYEFTVLYVAVLTYGAIAVPMNPAMPAPELAKTLGRADVSAAFIGRKCADGWADVLTAADLCEVGAADARGGAASGIDDRISLFVRSALAKAPAASGSESASSVSDDAPAVLMFTSGTTGDPKGVLLRHRHLWAAVQNVTGSHQLTDQDVAYCILPLFHINAQVIVFLSTLCSQGKLVMAERFSASSFWTTIQKHGVTWVSAVPAILTILAKKAQDLQAAASGDGTQVQAMARSLRFIRSASAPLPTAVMRQFESTYGVPVIESYGMTEAAGQICINPLPPGVRKTGSVGIPYQVQLRIVSSDDDRRVLPAGQTGEIEIRGDNIIESYVQTGASLPAQPNGRAAASAGAERGEDRPWLPTGDLGCMDEDGYVYITGRVKEIINRAGEKFSPRDVEEVLYAHPDVEKAAVAGLPDVTYGERVMAWVIQRPESSLPPETLAAQLLDLCQRSLAKFKWPSEIQIVDNLPVGATGKVKKHMLRQEPIAGMKRVLSYSGAGAL
ncbi:AMP-binding protein [Alicyclobacillus cycloheptanicus]|uniref:Acyl-CoA synthetase (AMP-forming)/AMP-acid ligase II n=1 Tax=Alicyclobacillus cycloheptanicus TaxID=1457 RepID=A0ABT9XIG6_9BACL|nr:AMP-binding protein [Alicyclobacillus cycloheptanicus]MDQ0190109.1 acyl-CoA synthetase (AMP-forming)/AMP-acid ligase II [Alicyclobacillus cycloheptanicus]WDM02082.1 AMP-binding protein [Alicyclobacillus cycloheptanicus]